MGSGLPCSISPAPATAWWTCRSPDAACATATSWRPCGSVPREAFVQPGFEEFAYEDGPLPIGEGQTISQPYIVALMIEAAEVRPGDRVLEVGAGSGYAAAVLSRIADRVYAIERHPSLGEAARRRFERLGYDNIELRVGDGTLGWPEAAPFDAILVAAGGPRCPTGAEGAARHRRPAGHPGRRGRRAAGTAQDHAHGRRPSSSEDDLGAVAFVPLIGEQGWAEDGRRSATNHVPGQSRGQTLPRDDRRGGRAAARPSTIPPSGGCSTASRDRRVVLLGEASHGTSEFYRARAAITRRLIEQHGFTIVAVEADWPDAAAVDRYVRHRPAPGRRRAAVPALPHLDVAQHRGRGAHRVAARAQRERVRARRSGPASTASTSTT